MPRKTDHVFPIVIRRLVKIYNTQNGPYSAFTLTFLKDGKRIRKKFSDLDEAKREGASIAEKLYSGQSDVLNLTSEDKALYLRAVEALKPTGTPLDAAAVEYAKAIGILGGHGLIEACRHYVKTHPTKLPRKTVREVFDAFLAAKKRSGRSADYLADIKYRCGKFAAAFQVCIADVTGQDVRDFLEGLNLSPRSQNNFRLSIATLFEFAKAQGFLPKDHGELDGIESMSEDGGAILIWTPEQMAELLRRARPELIPFLVIGGFSGLRSAELERLDWAQVNLARKRIEVLAVNAKTKNRRLAPIPDNAAQWLAPYTGQTGKVVPFLDIGGQIRDLCAERRDDEGKVTRPAIEWKHNGLRHSFVSYRVAALQNVAQVALEAGNSPRVVQTNYLEQVGPEDASAWFSILPAPVENVVPMVATA